MKALLLLLCAVVAVQAKIGWLKQITFRDFQFVWIYHGGAEMTVDVGLIVYGVIFTALVTTIIHAVIMIALKRSWSYIKTTLGFNEKDPTETLTKDTIVSCEN